MTDFKYGDLVLLTFTFVKRGADVTFPTLEFLNSISDNCFRESTRPSYKCIRAKRCEPVVCLNASPDDAYFMFFFKGHFLGYDKNNMKIKSELISQKNDMND